MRNWPILKKKRAKSMRILHQFQNNIPFPSLTRSCFCVEIKFKCFQHAKEQFSTKYFTTIFIINSSSFSRARKSFLEFQASTNLVAKFRFRQKERAAIKIFVGCFSHFIVYRAMWAIFAMHAFANPTESARNYAMFETATLSKFHTSQFKTTKHLWRDRITIWNAKISNKKNVLIDGRQSVICLNWW